MKCLNPIISQYIDKFSPAKSRTEKDGKYTYIFDDTKKFETDVYKFPCRKCFYCLQQRAREWALRCYLECKEHKENCILTLTYEKSPRSLQERDVQLFLKRLRKKIYPRKIKYFYGGEYGSLTKRPHFHMIVFGWRPNDCVPYNDDYFNSKLVNDCWGHGYVTIDLLPTHDGIAYTCGYVLKKAFEKIPQNLTQPFQRSSKGLGKSAFLANWYKYYSDGIYFQGKKYRPPEYFDYLLKQRLSKEEYYKYVLVDRYEKIEYEPHKESYETNLYRVKKKMQDTIDKRSKV